MELSPSIMNDIISLGQIASFNLRGGVTVTNRNMRTSKFGFKTVSTMGSIRSGKIPSNLKNVASLNIFKHKIKKWTPQKLLM